MHFWLALWYRWQAMAFIRETVPKLINIRWFGKQSEDIKEHKICKYISLTIQLSIYIHSITVYCQVVLIFFTMLEIIFSKMLRAFLNFLLVSSLSCKTSKYHWMFITVDTIFWKIFIILPLVLWNINKIFLMLIFFFLINRLPWEIDLLFILENWIL